MDEIRPIYTEKFGELATQMRSLGIDLLLAEQEAQHLKSAADEKISTLIANTAKRITGKILDLKDTLEILQLMAGKKVLSEVSGIMRQSGRTGQPPAGLRPLNLREHNKVSVEEVQKLWEGVNLALSRGR
jgi:intracellular multiplication protein IcmO